MQIDINYINNLLVSEDIEGLIELGAPEDEYIQEAEDIHFAIDKLGEPERTKENILAIISIIWMKNFELNQNDMELRLESLENIADNLLNNQ